MHKLRATRDEYGFRNIWAANGKILHKVEDTPDSKPAVYYQSRVCNRNLSYAEKNLFLQRSFVFVNFLFFYVGIF